MFSLENKVIVVTGSNGLLGKAIAGGVAAAGALVIGLDIKFAQESENNIVCDITSEEDVKRAIDNIKRKYGRIDGWVNNAYPRTADWGKPINEITMETWKTNVDLHMNSYFMCSRLILENMKEQRSGAVVNMGSIYGVQAPDFTVYEGTQMTSAVGYSAIKGGIINLTRYLASYYGQYNLRANCVSPGGVFDNQPVSFVQSYEKKVPLKRMANPGDIAPSIAFLLSDEASYITGHNLLVDGGWTIV
jgi:NAD(P)-dependent dehydrogenase (short-subunit alcohol dehydrogenase family)